MVPCDEKNAKQNVSYFQRTSIDIFVCTEVLFCVIRFVNCNFMLNNMVEIFWFLSSATEWVVDSTAPYNDLNCLL